MPLRKALDNVGIIDIVITSQKSAERNLDKQQSESGPSALCGTPHVFSSAHPGSSTVLLSQEEYERLRQVEFS